MREMKDSGVEWIGEIPRDKEVIRNKYLFEYTKGKLPVSTNLDGLGFPYIGASDLDSNSDYVTYTTDEDIPSAENDDLLVLWDGARAGLSGTNKSGKISSTVVRIRAKNTYAPFLYWYYKGFEDFMYQSVGGTTIPHMNRKYIEQIMYLNWSKDEQHRIADYLDRKCSKIDEIIEKESLVIEKLKAYKLSVITEAVTKGLNPDVPMKDSGSVWFDNVPNNWDTKKLKYLFHIQKNIAGEDGHTVLSITQRGIVPKDFSKNDGQFAESYSKYQLVNKGDFAMNHMDLLTGWVDISKYDGVTSPDYRVFVLTDKSQYISNYYLYMMQMCYSNKIFFGLGQGVSGLGRWRLQADKFLNFIITVPPLAEQQQIADYLDRKCTQIDETITKKQATIEKLTAYKKSLIYEVVTGKKEV